MALHMLTTRDNPYDPFARFDDWYQYDEDMGYCTSGYYCDTETQWDRP